MNVTVGKGGVRQETPPKDTPEHREDYQRNYLPIRFAGPLVTKLKKRYWERANVAGHPLVFAIQDFHEPMSMTWSRNALISYLYGMRYSADVSPDGSPGVTATPISTHKWGSKEIDSGFFRLPDSENVSAVLFNSSATISKFQRLGVAAGFGSGETVVVRSGLRIDPDPEAVEPLPFVDVVAEGYDESWIEDAEVFHNPHATHPLDPDQLYGAAHHFFEPDGMLRTVAPPWRCLYSVTSIIKVD